MPINRLHLSALHRFAVSNAVTYSAVSIAGVEVLEIIETQLLQRQPDGSLVVESKPVLAAPGASKFTTHALFSMSEAVNGKKSCKVTLLAFNVQHAIARRLCT